MSKYIALKKQVIVLGSYSIVPIRLEDRHLIMEWRNQQMYHLRQSQLLTKKAQDKYFKEIILKLFATLAGVKVKKMNSKRLISNYLTELRTDSLLKLLDWGTIMKVYLGMLF